MSKTNELQSIAVLIDADNTPPKKLKDVLDEIAVYGRIVVKKAYGNWKNEQLKNWEPQLKQLAIKPEQQFAYTTGKNATDILLTIDAMDLLATGIYDAFVLVSSDSDFTPLAIRLRESGVSVFGVGDDKTPDPFRNACDDFILIENLNTVSADDKNSKAVEAHDTLVSNVKTLKPADLSYIQSLLKIACDEYQDAEGWVAISAAGSFIKRLKPDFTAKTYGYTKLPDLVKAFPKKYETKTYQGKGGTTIFAYKCK